MKKEIVISGYGNVARELMKLLLEKQEMLKERYGLDAIVVGIAGSKGMINQEKGINLEALLMYGTGSTALSSYAKQFDVPFQQTEIKGDILVDCSPTNIENGEPGKTYIGQALENGMDVIAVSKGALVTSFDELMEMAEKSGAKLKYSGATAAALPTLDIGEYSLAGSTITSIKGVLNGTSNYILTCMLKENLSFAEALKIAQEQGIAEANASMDVKGIDSACKILLLANRLLGAKISLDDIRISGIEGMTNEDIEKVKAKGSKLKLIASASVSQDNVDVQVHVCELSKEHPLFQVDGTNKGIVFETKEMGDICVTGGASHPRAAAAAALKDLINIVCER